MKQKLRIVYCPKCDWCKEATTFYAVCPKCFADLKEKEVEK